MTLKRLRKLPHTLILTTYNGEPYEEEDAEFWDQAEIRCPHDPPSELVPCAVWDRCGCKPKRGQRVRGRCPKSATGWHWIDDEGEPNRPIASCWPADHAEGLEETARELGLPPGEYKVRPWCDDGGIRLELWNTRKASERATQ